MKAREWYIGLPQNGNSKYEFTYDELCNLLDDFAQSQAQLQQPVVVRGGAIEAQSVPLEGEALKWTNSAVTQITTTEPLPAEGLAKSVCGGVLLECTKCGAKLQWPVTQNECDNCA